MIAKVFKRADNFLRARCDKIPTSKRKGVVIAMFTTLVVIAVFNFITEIL